MLTSTRLQLQPRWTGTRAGSLFASHSGHGSASLATTSTSASRVTARSGRDLTRAWNSTPATAGYAARL